MSVTNIFSGKILHVKLTQDRTFMGLHWNERVVIYPLGIKFDVLHRLRLRKQNHLLYDEHLIVGVDGLMELSVIWNTKGTSQSEYY